MKGAIVDSENLLGNEDRIINNIALLHSACKLLLLWRESGVLLI